MMRTILMIDTGRASVRETAQQFADRGDQVFIFARKAYSLPGVQVCAVDLLDRAAVRLCLEQLGRMDLLILGVPPMTADGPIGSGHDTDTMLNELSYMGRGLANVVEESLPLMRCGMKRIACLTKRESSIGWARETDRMADHMAMAGLNLLGRELFNRLRPQGFTFRWYAEDGADAPMSAAEYFLTPLTFHPDEPACHNEEDRLVMRDGFLREIPW